MSDRFPLAAGPLGTFAAFTLGDANAVVGILAGLCTVGYMFERFRSLRIDNDIKSKTNLPKE
jgi:hypothetical protein